MRSGQVGRMVANIFGAMLMPVVMSTSAPCGMTSLAPLLRKASIACSENIGLRRRVSYSSGGRIDEVGSDQTTVRFWTI